MARIEQSIEVNAPARAIYEQLTQFEAYSRFIDDVKQVRQLDDTHLHWHTRAGNVDMEWDAEITQQIPDKCIAWRTTSGGPHYEGKIELKPGDKDRTRVTLTVECDPRQQLLVEHGDSEKAVAERAGHALAHFKKSIEKPAGAVLVSAGHAGNLPALVGHGQSASNEPKQAEGTEERGSRASLFGGMLPAWDGPFSLMRRITEDMDQFIDKFIGHPFNDARLRSGAMAGITPVGWTPPVEVEQREQQFVVRAELPGVRREDVHIEIKRDRLTIEGDRHQEPPRAAGEYRRSERSYGHFYRVIALPPGADPDAASASMQDGMLEVTVPVPNSGRQGRQIEIRTPRP